MLDLAQQHLLLRQRRAQVLGQQVLDLLQHAAPGTVAPDAPAVARGATPREPVSARALLRDAPRSYVQRYRQLAAPLLHNEAADRAKTLVIFYISSYGNTARMALAVRDGAGKVLKGG